MTFSRQEATKLYKGQLNPKIKERLLLILRVKDDGILPAHAADELHRSRPWALYWLDRFSKEGIEGLKDRSKTGRPPKIPEELAIRIRTKLLESKQGWTTKQVREMISMESGVDTTTFTYVGYFTSGVSNRRYQERDTLILLQ